VIELGLKLTVTPEGWPLAVRLIALSKPPVTVLVMAELPEPPPCATVIVEGEADSVNPGVGLPPARAFSKPLPLGLPHPVAKS
jgi:hypothetical protein